MKTTAMADARFVALKLYRLNLHGTGWKIESHQYSEARTILAEHIKWAKRDGDLNRLLALEEVRADLRSLQLSQPIKRAA